MFDFDNGNLPSAFDSLFKKINETHSYNTRSAGKGKLILTANSNTSKHGDLMLQNVGVKAYNKILDLPFYKKCKTKHSFSMKYKKYLISLY